MIKKIFLTFFWLFFLNITFCSSDFVVRNFWTYWVSPLVNSYDIAILKNWQFLTQNLGYTKNILMLRNSIYFLWTIDSKLYAVMWRNRDWQYAYFEWYLRKYQVCDEITSSSTTNTNCTTNYITDTSNSVFNNFFSSITNNDFYSLNMSLSASSYSSVKLCFSSSSVWHSLCFNASITNCKNLDRDPDMDCTNNLWLWIGGFDTINRSVLWNSPWYNWGWNNNNDWLPDWIIATWSNESAINYFENHYWRNENICYVWVNNTTDLWWSSVSFQEGAWLTIFEAFENLYWNQDLNKVYVWLNSRLLNYEQWFFRNWNPLYLSSYNSWTNQVDLYYDNLTFPFANNPVAVYFMSDYISRNSEYSTMWSEVVSYCNIKINGWSFDDIISDVVKSNINNYTEQSNKNKWYNPWFNYNWGDAWLSSWVEIAFSWNTTISNTLENFFWKLEEWIDSLKVTSQYKIFPDWLIGSFVFIVLFKFLRKKK